MKKITNFEFGTITFFLMRGLFIQICFTSLINISKQDSYISVIIGIILGIIPALLFLKLFNYEPTLNIFEKLNKLFGKCIGNIINVILIIIATILTIVSFFNLISFVYSQYLNKTPSILISITFIISIYYSLIKGFRNLLRLSIILFFGTIILFVMSSLGLIFQIDISNFKPFFSGNILSGSISFISYSIFPLFMLLLIPKNNITNPQKSKLTFILFYVIGCLSILIIMISIIGIFGYKMTLLYEYPEFQILNRVSLTGILTRLESILFLQWIFTILIFITFALNFVKKGIIHIIKIKENILNIIFPVMLLISGEFIKIIFINSISVYILRNIILATIGVFILISSIVLFYKNKIHRA